MSIKVNHLTKAFKDRTLFKDFTYSFKDKGLYSIIGESGSGKSTLLSILSLIDTNYKGEIKFNNLNIKDLKENEINDIRVKNFGFLFQSFNLFNDDKVINNIRLTLDATSDIKEEFKLRKINDVLTLLDINEIKESYVRDLSGGEKERVALARTLINSPEVIFCDEPTGALDEINATKVFELLKTISKDTLIILVTHDESKAYKYSDVILKIKDQEIKEVKVNKIKKVEEFNTIKIKDKKRFPRLSNKFLFMHLKSKYKLRKFRNLIKNFLLGTSFIISGLALTLTEGLNRSLMSSFEGIIDDKVVVLNKKGSKSEVIDYYSVGKNEIYSLLNEYKNDLDYYGVNYLVDYENYFIDENDVYSLTTPILTKLKGFSARTFNEFIYKTNYQNDLIYPEYKRELMNDEIIISLSLEQVKEVCKSLKIVKTIDSLSEYLLTHDYFVTLRVRNNSWSYSDEQLFKVKHFILDTKNRIYHTNPLFNEVVFEENMRMPTSTNPNKIEKYPWIFKKVYFVHTINFQSIFLNKVFYDPKYQDFIFDSDNKFYSPLNCSYDLKNTNRVYIYKGFKDTINLEIFDFLDSMKFPYNSFYFSSPNGYFSNGVSLFNGFSRPLFFSLSETKNNEVIDAYSKVKESDLINIKVPKGVVDGYALKPSSNNVRLKVTYDELKPFEIIISEGFKRILNELDVKNKIIYASLMKNSYYYEGDLKNEFETIKLNIKDVKEDDLSVSIYQNKDFSISLFRDLFKVSSFSLIPNSIIFEMDKSLNEDELNYYSNIFKDYEFLNPIISIEKSVNESTFFLKIILIIFSVITIISSLILMIIISLITALEERKEISYFKVLGFQTNEILKVYIYDNLLSSSSSYIFSSISLIFLNFFLGKVISDMLGVPNLFLFSFLPFIFNFFLMVLLSVLGAFITKKEIKNTDIMKNIH